MEIRFFKKALVVFWALWFVIAFFTDFFGWLDTFDNMHISWAGTDNYSFLVKSLHIFSVPDTVAQFLYFGIIAWLFVSSLAFIFASVVGFTSNYSRWLKFANYAFIISLCLWFVFFLADQLVMNFDLEANHMVQAGVEFISYLALYILPDSK
jgi:hypothetical protein